MAGKISQILDAAPLTGAELFELSQVIGPVLATRRATLAQIAAKVANLVAAPITLPSADFGVTLHEEFLAALGVSGAGANARGAMGLVSYVTGAGAPAATQPSIPTVDHPGIYQLATGSTLDSSTASVAGAQAVAVPSPGKNMTLEVLMQTGSPLPAVGANYRVEVGFSEFQSGQSSYAELVTSIFYYQSDTNAGRWTIRTRSGGGAVDFDTGVMPTASQWVRLGVELAAPNTLFYINGTLVHTATTGPQAGNTVFPIPLLIRKTVGGGVGEGAGAAVARTYIDYAALILAFTGGR